MNLHFIKNNEINLRDLLRSEIQQYLGYNQIFILNMSNYCEYRDYNKITTL